MSKANEDKVHRGLKNKIKIIMDNLGLTCYKEVHLNLTGAKEENDYIDETSIDLLVTFSHMNKKSMIFFEFKNRKEIEINKEIASTKEHISQILKGNVYNIKSWDSKVNSNIFKNVEEIRVCFVFTKKLNKNKYESYKKLLEKNNMFIWDENTTTYYQKISSIIGKISKYELLLDFKFDFGSIGTREERAVKIKLPDSSEMYLVGIHPGLLLQMGYVLRRTSQKTYNYQRLLKKEKIKKISEFLSSKKSFLPNAIIIVFDNDVEIQNKLKYDNNKAMLTFPTRYCSAWIIDGQHRLYGFINSKHGEWTPEVNENFKIPVIAFKNLDEMKQAKTFVEINQYQKSISPALINDLSTLIKDMNNEKTWPSLLVSKLNKEKPFERMIKISELDYGKPISINSFSNFALLESLLGYNKIKGGYKGKLYEYAPFNIKLKFNGKENRKAFDRQSELLIRYFNAVKTNTEKTDERINPWVNIKNYALLKPTGINSLLLVLSKIMEKYPDVNIDLDSYLKPLEQINFERNYVSNLGGGWKGFRAMANEIIKELNKQHNNELKLFNEKEKN